MAAVPVWPNTSVAEQLSTVGVHWAVPGPIANVAPGVIALPARLAGPVQVTRRSPVTMRASSGRPVVRARFHSTPNAKRSGFEKRSDVLAKALLMVAYSAPSTGDNQTSVTN